VLRGQDISRWKDGVERTETMDEDDGRRVFFVSTFLRRPEARDVDEVAGKKEKKSQIYG
jgi:hypothetical protein